MDSAKYLARRNSRVARRLASSCIFGALVLALPAPVLAEPMVVGGLYPRNGQTYNAPDNTAPQPEASNYAAPAPAPAPDPYGGGFFELLMTGHTPAQAPRRAHAMSALAYGTVPASAAIEDPRLLRGINPIYQRQEVAYNGPQKPGTIVVDTPEKFLFLVEKGGKAIRYGIGVGRPGFAWSGVKRISRKAEWPTWTPPEDMLKRRPDLPRFMPGGPANPLGARALYLGSSLYRIHGTNEPYTIGTNVSSGCIRMMNKDVEDLYDRVAVGTKVVVM